MPRTPNTHVIIESDELSAFIDKAAMLWPDQRDDRTALLNLIIEEGMKVTNSKFEEKVRIRLEALERLCEMGTGLWPADWDETRKAEWPD